MKNRQRPNFTEVGEYRRSGMSIDQALHSIAHQEAHAAHLKASQAYDLGTHSFQYLESSVDYVKQQLDYLEGENRISGRVYRVLQAFSLNLENGIDYPYTTNKVPKVAASAEKVHERIQKTAQVLHTAGFGPRSAQEIESDEVKKDLKINLRALLLEAAQFMHDYSTTEIPRAPPIFQKSQEVA